MTSPTLHAVPPAPECGAQLPPDQLHEAKRTLMRMGRALCETSRALERMLPVDVLHTLFETLEGIHAVRELTRVRPQRTTTKGER